MTTKESLSVLLSKLEPAELGALRVAIEQRIDALTQVPTYLVRQARDQGFALHSPKGDGIFWGRVIAADHFWVMLRTGANEATVLCFPDGIISPARGSLLEITRHDGQLEMSQERGKRWAWVRIEESQIFELLQNCAISDEYGVGCRSKKRVLEVPNSFDSVHEGTILGRTEKHVLQRVGPEKVVAHCLMELPRIPTVGSEVQISYRRGHVQSVRRTQGLALGR